MSETTRREFIWSDGLRFLPPDPTPEEMAAAPALKSLDDLVIDDLTEEEHPAFMAAIAEARGR